MCGIAGVVMRDGSAPEAGVLERLQAAIAHRGPDGQGVLVRGDTALVHNRLAIIDLVTGDQPLYAPGGAVLVCNGEIYNNPELRAGDGRRAVPHRSRIASRRCSSTSATAWLTPTRLRGMYAIAIHDPARDRLVLTRDPFGIKPLYYVQTETLFAFASEPQALIAAGLARPAIDARRRAELLQLKFTTGADDDFPGHPPRAAGRDAGGGARRASSSATAVPRCPRAGRSRSAHDEALRAARTGAGG